ncbi:MAG: LPS export ABC transporter periplasmic protein LptC [Roseobacter sp.]
MQPDRYSRMVAWLKVALPLLALGILSTLFMISRAVTPPTVVPFADTEVQERLTNQQITGPFFSGTSESGDEIAFVADKVTTPNGQIGTNKAQNVDVQIDLTSGTRIIVTADEADMNIAQDQTELIGNVVAVTTRDQVLQSERVLLRMSEIEMISPGDVTITGPFGNINAGAMHVFTPDGETNSQILFTKGVKLLYHTKVQEE